LSFVCKESESRTSRITVSSRLKKTRGATGKPIEVIGSYNPRGETATKKIVIKADRYQHWVSVGAKPSETVESLVKAVNKSAKAAAKA
jgi:small subunit ribosomal protein S16